jgi:hypothetical protein
MNHLQACGHCPKYEHGDGTQKSHTGCEVYADVAWVNRIGGCGMFPERDMPESHKRVGQQKQKHSDRSYHSKNDSRGKFRRVAE